MRRIRVIRFSFAQRSFLFILHTGRAHTVHTHTTDNKKQNREEEENRWMAKRIEKLLFFNVLIGSYTYSNFGGVPANGIARLYPL